VHETGNVGRRRVGRAAEQEQSGAGPGNFEKIASRDVGRVGRDW
jgi:hypothetical protein